MVKHIKNGFHILNIKNGGYVPERIVFIGKPAVNLFGAV
jgi:hypothetical protein